MEFRRRRESRWGPVLPMRPTPRSSLGPESVFAASRGRRWLDRCVRAAGRIRISSEDARALYSVPREQDPQGVLTLTCGNDAPTFKMTLDPPKPPYPAQAMCVSRSTKTRNACPADTGRDILTGAVAAILCCVQSE